MLKSLDINANNAINYFVGLLRQNQGDNLVRVALYGSLARGDYTEDSDIDIFVLLKQDDYEISLSIVKDAQKSDMECGEFCTYISPMTYTLEDYNRWESSKKRIPIILSKIKEEGVLLYDADAR